MLSKSSLLVFDVDLFNFIYNQTMLDIQERLSSNIELVLITLFLLLVNEAGEIIDGYGFVRTVNEESFVDADSFLIPHLLRLLLHSIVLGLSGFLLLVLYDLFDCWCRLIRLGLFNKLCWQGDFRRILGEFLG